MSGSYRSVGSDAESAPLELDVNESMAGSAGGSGRGEAVEAEAVDMDDLGQRKRVWGCVESKVCRERQGRKRPARQSTWCRAVITRHRPVLCTFSRARTAFCRTSLVVTD